MRTCPPWIATMSNASGTPSDQFDALCQEPTSSAGRSQMLLGAAIVRAWDELSTKRLAVIAIKVRAQKEVGSRTVESFMACEFAERTQLVAYWAPRNSPLLTDSGVALLYQNTASPAKYFLGRLSLSLPPNSEGIVLAMGASIIAAPPTKLSLLHRLSNQDFPSLRKPVRQAFVLSHFLRRGDTSSSGLPDITTQNRESRICFLVCQFLFDTRYRFQAWPGIYFCPRIIARRSKKTQRRHIWGWLL